MPDSKLEKWLPVTGLLFALGMIAVLFLPQSPSSDAGEGSIVAFYSDKKTSVFAASFVLAVMALLAVTFAACIRNHIAKSEDGGLMSELVLAAGAVFGTGILVLAGTVFATVDTINYAGPAMTHTLHVLNNELFIPMFGGWALFLLASSGAILRSRALPAWTGWMALVLGVMSISPIAWFALMLGIIWMASVSILLITRYGNGTAAMRSTGEAAVPVV